MNGALIVKLAIRRDQADVKGMFGGHKGVTFSLWYCLRLTAAESQLVDRYKLREHVLCRNSQGTTLLTVGEALDGVTENLTSVEILLQNEKVVKGACKQFKVLLDVASSFGGEEVVEID